MLDQETIFLPSHGHPGPDEDEGVNHKLMLEFINNNENNNNNDNSSNINKDNSYNDDNNNNTVL